MQSEDRNVIWNLYYIDERLYYISWKCAYNVQMLINIAEILISCSQLTKKIFLNTHKDKFKSLNESLYVYSYIGSKLQLIDR